MVLEVLADKMIAYNSLFIHVEKTAGTSIGVTIERHEILSKRILQFISQHSPASHLKERLRPHIWDNLFKFAFVRHPYDRLVSWYYFSKGRYEQFQNDTIDQFFQKRHNNNTMLRPMKTLLCNENGDVLPDFVGHFETLKEDWNYIVSHICRSNIEVPLLKVNQSPNRLFWQECMTPTVQKILDDYYGEDFQIWSEYKKCG